MLPAVRIAARHPLIDAPNGKMPLRGMIEMQSDTNLV
jgi:hypothetical protein